MFQLGAQLGQRGQRVARQPAVVLARGEQIGDALAMLAQPVLGQRRPAAVEQRDDPQPLLPGAHDGRRIHRRRPDFPPPGRCTSNVTSNRTASVPAAASPAVVTCSRGTRVADGLTIPAAAPDRSPRQRFSFSTNRGASAAPKVVRRPGKRSSSWRSFSIARCSATVSRMGTGPRR